MVIIVDLDEAGKQSKEITKSYLLDNERDVVDITEGQEADFVDAALAVAEGVQGQEGNLGIIIDASGVGSFMVTTKIKDMIATEVLDERLEYVTRGHNSLKMITTGSEIVEDTLMENVVEGFVEGKYDDGRHQIRVDMFNKMC